MLKREKGKKKKEDEGREGGRRKTHSSDESTSSTLIHSKRYSLENRFLRLRVPKRDVLERDEIPSGSKLGWLA